jgi:hypothetical protein
MTPHADTMHRGVKMAVDSGECASLDEALGLFRSYSITVVVGTDAAQSPTSQAAILTAVNTGMRCCLGGVRITGDLQRPLLVPCNGHSSLVDAMKALGGTADAGSEANPTLLFGDASAHPSARAVLQVTWNGWIAGASPPGEPRLAEQQEFTPAGVLAGALGVSEMFQVLRKASPLPGRRSVGMSLWEPALVDWKTAGAGPHVREWPSRLHLIGLGHLGQALLWTLGFLPYQNPKLVELTLQDVDTLVPANCSTSPLTTDTNTGQRKTRAMAAWCEQRGFTTHLVERRFGDHTRIAEGEATVAFCGVDNARARAALEGAGFNLVVEAGLGSGPQQFLDFQVHTFPGQISARAIWPSSAPEEDQVHRSHVLQQPGWKRLEQSIGACGVATLADRSVGAPFVGCVAACLQLAEVLRFLAGGSLHAQIDGSLACLQHHSATVNSRPPLPFNPGMEASA